MKRQNHPITKSDHDSVRVAAIASFVVIVCLSMWEGLQPQRHDSPTAVESVFVPSEPQVVAVMPAVAKPAVEDKPLIVRGDFPTILGGQWSETIQLQAGQYRIRSTHQGTDMFTADLYTTDVRHITSVARQAGITDVSVDIALNEGLYKFNLQADGPWAFEITRL